MRGARCWTDMLASQHKCMFDPLSRNCISFVYHRSGDRKRADSESRKSPSNVLGFFAYHAIHVGKVCLSGKITAGFWGEIGVRGLDAQSADRVKRLTIPAPKQLQGLCYTNEIGRLSLGGPCPG